MTAGNNILANITRADYLVLLGYYFNSFSSRCFGTCNHFILWLWFFIRNNSEFWFVNMIFFGYFHLSVMAEYHGLLGELIETANYYNSTILWTVIITEWHNKCWCLLHIIVVNKREKNKILQTYSCWCRYSQLCLLFLKYFGS